MARSRPSSTGTTPLVLPAVARFTFGILLRPGNVPATQGAVGVLRACCAVAPRLSPGAFPRAARTLRVLDAEPRLDYVVAMAKNAVLVRHAEPCAVRPSMSTPMSSMLPARGDASAASFVRLTGRAPQDNSRFVVTNLFTLHERIYCRGDIENRIKELHDGLQIGRELLSLLGESAARRTPAARRAETGCSSWGPTSCRSSSSTCRGVNGLARLATHALALGARPG